MGRLVKPASWDREAFWRTQAGWSPGMEPGGGERDHDV